MTATSAPSALPRPAALPRTTRPHVDLAAWRGLSVVREDIVFSTTRPGLLRVEVRVSNCGPRATPATAALLQSAPLGAFVPWQPLDLLAVPALSPGESAVVTGEYRYEAPEALGSIDKLPPNRALVALGLGEPGRERRRWRTPALPNVGVAPKVAADLLAMLGQGSAHWAGNLNLFFPGVDVERHVAQALRVHPGRVNLAAFIVGSADEYQFGFSGNATEWKARLYDASLDRPIAEGVRNPAIREDAWERTMGFLLLSVEPPADAEAGAVNVHVRQRSSNREAVVEFTMDSRAAGPGCYAL
ncbi:MAG TPA: hypothetical protein VM529_20350 [Gemmata sp.]|nr:hypothetical protein [Gemmata sp.]